MLGKAEPILDRSSRMEETDVLAFGYQEKDSQFPINSRSMIVALN
jgi:hypothetical protein